MVIAAGCDRSDRGALPGDTVGVISPGTDSDVSPSPAISADPDAVGSRTCGVTGATGLTEEGIGELRPGRTVEEVKALCDVTSDAQQRGAEGMMERVIVVRMAGEVIPVTVTDNKVWRIELDTPRFRTADSLGVDTPLRRIAGNPGAQFAPGEDGIYGFVPDHCGLSFRFSLPLRPPAGGQWTAKSIGAAHPDAAVNRVLVTRCAR